MSRQKGNRLERTAAAALIAADGPDPLISKVASSTGRVGHLDLGADFYTRRLAGEAKSRESIGKYLWEWLDHIDPIGHVPLLVVKRNRHRPLVVLSLDDFITLIQED